MTDKTAAATPKVRIVRSPGMPTIYVEGVAQMMVGFPNTRLTLSQLSQSNGEGEEQEDVHHLACELVVPTAALIEMANGILRNMGQSKGLLQSASTEWLDRVGTVFETLPGSPTEGAQER